MPITRISVAGSIDPENVGGGIVTNGEVTKNAVYEKYPDDRFYATQRPSLSIVSQASSYSVNSKRARGIYYWNAVGQYVIVVDNKVYLGDYSGPMPGTISSGKDPVTILELGSYLIILDAENNVGWTIISSAPTTLVQITDADFPCNIVGKTIAGGGCTLDGYLFVMTTDKFIYNSAQYDPTSWDALDFIRAEREQDLGIYLTKHHDQIAAFGARSIEFFYDAGNPVGSPLVRRDDVSYRVGPIDRKAIYSTDDRVYFLGSERIGGVGLFLLEQFNYTKVSNSSIDTYLSFTRARSGFDFILAGFATGPHNLVFITCVAPGTTWDPTYTLVYDATYGIFTQFESTISNVDQFSCVMSSSRSTAIQREPEMLFLSGDIGVFDMTFTRQDTAGTGGYFTINDYIVNQNDYILNLGGNTVANFEFKIRLGESDFGSVTNKFVHRMSVVGTTTSAALSNDPIYVSWTDDHYKTFSSERPLETGENRSLTRLGKFRRRAFNLRYAGTDALRIEGIELDLRASQYA